MPLFRRLVLALALASGAAQAQPVPEDSLKFDGYTLGATVRVLNGGEAVHLVLPFSEARVPLGRGVSGVYGGHVLWGVTGLFAEVNVTGAVLVEVVPGVALRAGGHLGSFLLDNVSATGAAGVVLTLPLGRGRAVSVEAEVLARHSTDLLGFVALQDPEALTLDGAGVGLGVGLRW